MMTNMTMIMIMIMIMIIIVSITKYLLVIGSPHAYLPRNCSAVTWVSNYSCPI